MVEKLKIVQRNIFVIYTYRPSFLSSRKPQELEGKMTNIIKHVREKKLSLNI